MAKRQTSNQPATIASVHRFHNRVGAFIGEANGTAYLSVAEARAIAAMLLRAANSIDSEKFVDSPSDINLTITEAGRY